MSVTEEGLPSRVTLEAFSNTCPHPSCLQVFLRCAPRKGTLMGTASHRPPHLGYIRGKPSGGNPERDPSAGLLIVKPQGAPLLGNRHEVLISTTSGGRQRRTQRDLIRGAPSQRPPQDDTVRGILSGGQLRRTTKGEPP